MSLQKNIWRLGLLFAVAFNTTSVLAQAPDETDTQQWNDVQFAVPITKQIDFVLAGTLRLGRNLERPVDERIGAGVIIRFGRYFSVGPNYQYIGTQPFQ